MAARHPRGTISLDPVRRRLIWLPAALILLVPAAPAAARYPWRPIEEAAFGDPGNRGVVALEAFGSRLFAGTERWGGSGPAQLWTSASGEPRSWTRVGDLRPPPPASATAISALAGAPGGPLFLGTADPAGAAVYRSGDGVTWELATGPGSGWLPARALAVSALAVHGGAVYAGTRHPRGGALWRAPLTGGRFERVLAFGGRRAVTDAVTALQRFRGHLYAGTHRTAGNGRLWRSASGAPGTWRAVRVHDRGRVRPGNVTMGSALAVFEGALHVATRNPRFGAELYRTRDGRRWSVATYAGIPGAERRHEEIHDFARTFDYLWMIEAVGLARVWRAQSHELSPGEISLGFHQTNDDGFGRRTIRGGLPVVAAFRDAVYWGGRDTVHGAQVWRVGQADIDRFDGIGPGVRFAPGPLRLAPGGVVAVTIRCPREDPNGCRGQLTVRTHGIFRIGAVRRRILIGRKIFEMDAGRSLTLRFRVPAAERRVLRRLGRVGVRARSLELDNAHDSVADYVLEA